MDKCGVIRSVVGATGGHDALPVHDRLAAATRSPRSAAGRASARSLPRLQGPVDPSVPPFVGLAAPTQHMPWSDPGATGFLGPAYAAVQAGRAGHGEHDAQRRRPSTGSTTASGCSPASTTSAATSTPTARSRASTPPPQRAFDVLTSSKLRRRPRPLEGRPAKVRERYGDGKPYKFQYDGAPTVNDQLLVARRLVEAGRPRA